MAPIHFALRTCFVTLEKSANHNLRESVGKQHISRFGHRNRFQAFLVIDNTETLGLGAVVIWPRACVFMSFEIRRRALIPEPPVRANEPHGLHGFGRPEISRGHAWQERVVCLIAFRRQPLFDDEDR